MESIENLQRAHGDNFEGMSEEQLHAEINARDVVVQKLRAEQLALSRPWQVKAQIRELTRSNTSVAPTRINL